MEDRRPTLEILKEANPRMYAELCEQAGCYSAALDFYSKSNDLYDLLKGLKLCRGFLPGIFYKRKNLLSK